MKENRLEFSLLAVTRLLLIYWILNWLAIPIVYSLLTKQGDWFYFGQVYLVGFEGLALGLLLWPKAQQWLGKWFFPLVVVIAAIPFFIQRHGFLTIVTSPTSTEVDFLHAFALRYDLVLLTLLVAWKYAFRYVVLFIGVISFVDWVMVFQIAQPESATLISLSFQLFFRIVIFLLVGYMVTYLRQRQQAQQQALLEANERQKQMNEKLAQYATTIERLSTSQERNRLARELHDTLAHSLSALSVQLEAVRSLWDVDTQAARTMLERADEITRTGLVEVRRSLQALRATPLEELGLMKALQNLANSVAKRADLQLNLKITENEMHLPQPIEQGIYRIVQEALENIVRHANATQITVHIQHTANELQFTIIDNGIGFDSQSLKTNPKKLGIQGMHERAEMIGGTLQVTSDSQVGTQVAFTLSI